MFARFVRLTRPRMLFFNFIDFFRNLILAFFESGYLWHKGILYACEHK
jgi:hypothetical protein